MTKNPNIYITAIIPAHNEEAKVSAAIKSIRDHVDKIIVACDNCDDRTGKIADQAGADIIFDTVNNKARKAGAINQALDNHVDWAIKNQYFLIMDADTEVVEPDKWFKRASGLVYPNQPRLNRKLSNLNVFKKMLMRTFQYKKFKKAFDNKAFDCVGSIFQAPQTLEKNNNIEEGQRLEWEAYSGKIERVQKVYVLTGTCSLISANIMQRVLKYHGGNSYYSETSITEDFEMTISAKEVGARLISPTECLCYTDTKSTVGDLLKQRRRWYLGALELVFRKFDRVMLPYLFQQITLFFSVFAYLLFLGLFAYLYITQNILFSWFGIGSFLLFDIDQTMRIWKYGSWFDRFYSMSMIGTLYYSFLLQIAYLWALGSFILGSKVYWNGKEQK